MNPDSRALKQLDARLCDWQPDFVGTLAFIVSGDSVLLIRKKRGHGAGKLNGPGGKVEAGETPLAGVIRETEEEVGVRLIRPELLGRFRFVDLRASQWLGFAFLARTWEGTPVETDEARPHWFDKRRLPFDEMWEDDRYWLPRLLNGESLTGDFLFDDGRLLVHRLFTDLDG
ncbi:MAG: 8-oxo-dGTP diphosphatase [Pseudomonadales bacterium]|nr:8-oxo-dGTP diphosphatase [Pseudomonadales bacterium]